MAKLSFDGPAVGVQEIADAIGGVGESVEYYARALALKFVLDWRGDRALRLQDAFTLVATARSAQQEHSDKWQRYRLWLVAKRETAARKRAEEWQKEQARLAEIRDTRRRSAEQELAIQRQRDAEAAEADRATSGLTFADFEKTL